MSYFVSAVRCSFAAIYFLASSVAYAATVSEEDLRAAYLYNFALLVEWPTKALPPAATQLTLCHVGEDDAASGRGVDALARLAGRKINDREIVFKRLQSVTELKNCHIALIGELDRGAISRLSDALRNSAVLTVAMERDAVSESPQIAISLSIERDRMVFCINEEYVKRTGLIFSSKLMRLAKKSP